jgi:hypothetical protein
MPGAFPFPEKYCLQHRPQAALLRVSRRIHDEAKIVMYKVNVIMFGVRPSDEPENTSVMGRDGFQYKLLFYGPTDQYQIPIEPIPQIDVLKHIRIMVLSLSSPWVKGTDIVPTKKQRLSGLERPSFRPLLEVVTEICDILKQFLHIRLLQLSIRVFDKSPDNIELLLKPILKLRNIIEVKPAVFSKRDGDEDWIDWTLKMSYQRWMNHVMALPEGAEVPEFVDTDYLGTKFIDYSTASYLSIRIMNQERGYSQ